MGRNCPGYRNAVDLVFLDESKQLIQRHQRRVGQDQGAAGEETGIALMRAAVTTPIKLTDFVLYQPLDELGVNFFMSNYVCDGSLHSELTVPRSR
jgi:hypothetical protein